MIKTESHPGSFDKVGHCPLFYFWGMTKQDHSAIARVWEITEPVAAEEGMEIVDIECRHEGSGRVLRIYLDKENGPNVDELSRISRQLSDLLDVHDPVGGSYVLEVSSPGINRLLKKPEHFARFVGRRIRVRTQEMIQGRKSFLGLLKEVAQDHILLDQDRSEFRIPFVLIEKANYEHDWGSGKRS
jgi:ribosome maturation factor RimP